MLNHNTPELSDANLQWVVYTLAAWVVLKKQDKESEEQDKQWSRAQTDKCQEHMQSENWRREGREAVQSRLELAYWGMLFILGGQTRVVCHHGATPPPQVGQPAPFNIGKHPSWLIKKITKRETSQTLSCLKFLLKLCKPGRNYRPQITNAAHDFH